jgi:Kef-type K+ transport system membrane component KefB
MPFWQRFLITLLVMLAASLVVGLIWQRLFSMPIPSYLAGIIGGLIALPVWEFLKWIKSKEKSG